MNTEDLISDLSREPPCERCLPPIVVVPGAALASLALALLLSVLWFEPRDDIATALIVGNHVFLVKLAFALSVITISISIVCDLSVPGRRIRGLALSAIPFVVLIVLALQEFAERYTGALPHHAGHDAWECLWEIPSLAAPAFIILAVAVRRLAPTDLRLTGAYIGLLAGGIGTIGHALDCHHESVVVVGIVYTLAVLETALLGAIVGPRILRWT